MEFGLWIVTGIALLISFCKNRGKTIGALKMATKRLWKITPLFLSVMAIFSFFITAVQKSFIQETIGADSGITGLLLSLGIGSLAFMPGFIAFPLCAMLKTQGIPFYILAGFSVALMNVGILSFPLQKQYLGWKVAVVRNVTGFLAALLIAIIVGIIFREIAI
jgi:uncharacterized membrane protein YraQ (UPF0718 family)